MYANSYQQPVGEILNCFTYEKANEQYLIFCFQFLPIVYHVENAQIKFQRNRQNDAVIPVFKCLVINIDFCCRLKRQSHYDWQTNPHVYKFPYLLKIHLLAGFVPFTTFATKFPSRVMFSAMVNSFYLVAVLVIKKILKSNRKLLGLGDTILSEFHF